MVSPLLDSRGNPISYAAADERVSIMGVQNFRAGLPNADPNPTFGPYQRRGTGGSLSGKYQEMMQTHGGISAAVYWAITEAASLPKEVCWPHPNPPTSEEQAFIDLCQRCAIDEAVVFDGTLEGANALWQYPIYDAFMGFGLMLPRLLPSGGVEWYPVAHSSVMLWRPEGYFLAGVQFSTGNGYANIDGSDLVHVVHGTATAGEWEGRSILRSLLQPYELWKQTALNAGIYNQQSWGFLDISYGPSVSTDDINAMNEIAGQFQDGVRKYLLRPKEVDVEMKYPSGTGPDVISQLVYWDTVIQRMLNDNLSGISQFGSRAMAETIDTAAGRKARAWVDGIFERASRSMFSWLARAVGYEGPLPIIRVQAAQLTTGLAGWSAYIQGVQSGLITKGPGDEEWARRVIGAPELPKDQLADVTAETPAPLLVGSLQIAQQILAAIGGPLPIAPGAAIILLQSAGISEVNARAMVEAQLAAMPAPAPVPLPVEPPPEPPPSAEPVPVPATAESTVTVGTNVQVPAAIGESPAFAPASVSASDDLAESDVDTYPTDEMKTTSERALAWRREHGRGGTSVGVARARDISAKKRLSVETVRRMKAYFDRHASDSKATGFNKGEEGFPSAGRVAWDLWGGDAGRDWAERKVASLDLERDGAALSAAELADIPEIQVPEAVKAVVQAAIELHRAAGKNKTTDTNAMMIARDLSAGKRIAWARVLALAKYFAGEYPRHSTTKSFKEQGPSWHGFNLRGGEACMQWVKKLVTDFALGSIRRAAKLGEENDVLVTDGNGQEFLTYRPLRPEEEVVAFVALADDMVEVDAALGPEIEAVAQEHRAATIKALADGWQAGERDSVYATFVARYAAILAAAAEDVRTFTEAEVANEIVRTTATKTIAPALRGAVTGTAEQFAAASTDQFAKSAALTQVASETIASRVQGEVENAILVGADMATFASQITMAGLVNNAATALNSVASAARTNAYASAPAAAGLVPTKLIRSSIPDKNRCEVCEQADGQVIMVKDWINAGQLVIPELPDPNCLGRGNCRCGWFAEYGTI
jgi:hypothetical protein